MDDDMEELVSNLLTKVRRILPAHAELISESEDNGASKGWVAHAREELDAARKVVEEFEEYLGC